MIYTALLRGINVGGNNKINMKELKSTFEKAGMEAVQTYINSGNIIFSHPDISQKKLSLQLETAIKLDFNLSIRVLIRDLNDLNYIMEALPGSWVENRDMKTNIMFLWEEIDSPSLLEKVLIKPEIDRVNYIPGTLIWNIDRINNTKSGQMKLAGTKLYKQMTIRNANTVRKIYALMKEFHSNPSSK